MAFNRKNSEIISIVWLIGGLGGGIVLLFAVGIFVMLFDERVTASPLHAASLPSLKMEAPKAVTTSPPTASHDPKAKNAFLSTNELMNLLPSRAAKWGSPLAAEFKEVSEGMPYYPHRATTGTNPHKHLDPASFDSATVCSACHVEIHQQWSESVMSKAWDDPIYRALLKRASIATNGAVDNFCTGCHSPVGLTTGKINSEINREPLDAAFHENRVLPGVDCEGCHNISALTGIDNGAYVLTPRNNPEGAPQKYGPRKDSESPYHKSVYSPLHSTSEFCGACHNVTHPFSHTPIERTFDEWQESSYNFNDQSCQDCHMPKYKGKAAIMGKERDDIASHTFTGGNVTLLNHFGLTAAAERSREMLRRAGTIEIVEAPEQFVPGSVARVSVKVSNTGTGHKLPTGFPEGREVWIDFKVTNENGDEVYRLGRVVDGKTEKGTKNFKVHLGDANGHEVDLDVWTVTHIISDNRILPNGYSIVDYDVPVPQNIQGPLKVEATLKYWPFNQHTVDLLLGAGTLPVEIVDMASVAETVKVSGSQTKVAVLDRP